MLEILLIVAALGLWQVILDRLGGLPGWVRAAMRAGLLLVVLAQAALYVWVTWVTRSVPVQEIPQVLWQVQTWSDRVHLGSAAVLLLAGLTLLGLSIQRARSRPTQPPEPPS